MLSSTEKTGKEFEFNLEWRAKLVSQWQTGDSWGCVCKEDPWERKTEVGLSNESHETLEKPGRHVGSPGTQ